MLHFLCLVFPLIVDEKVKSFCIIHAQCQQSLEPSIPLVPPTTPARPSHLAEMPDVVSDREKRTAVTRERYDGEFAREELKF